jgi:multiple sugar transport system permease protein
VAILTILPILYAILSSFKTNSEIFAHPENLWPKSFTLDNYAKLFNSDAINVPRMLMNSIYYTGVYVIITLFTTTLAGYAFARGNFPFKKIIFGLFSSLMFIQIGNIGIYATFKILAALHLTSSLHSLLIVKVFGISIVGIYLVRSYINTLPKELDEAALIDGCGRFGIFFRIIFPLLAPITATLALIFFQNSWNEYLLPAIFTQSSPEQQTLIVGIITLKNSGEGAAAVNLMLAMTTLALIPVICVYILCNKYFVSGLTAGAVKG